MNANAVSSVLVPSKNLGEAIKSSRHVFRLWLRQVPHILKDHEIPDITVAQGRRTSFDRARSVCHARVCLAEMLARLVLARLGRVCLGDLNGATHPVRAAQGKCARSG